MKNIEQTNALIATFMGLQTISLKEFENNPSSYNINEFSISEYQRYHLEWNWLIPVVQKIYETKEYYTYVQETSGLLSETYHLTEEIMAILKVDVIYEKVTDFISWYNSQL